jgi:Fe-S cluster assembly protein SufB
MGKNTENFLSSYKYGFQSNIESEKFPKGLSEQTIIAIAKKRNDPDFILEFRLKAFALFQKMKPPTWANVQFVPIDFQNICYYSEPKQKPKLDDLDQVDPEILKTLEKLGIPLDEQKRLTNVAMDVVFDSVSIGTTFKDKLKKAGVILCSISEAIHLYPDLVKKYLGSVVSMEDNYYAALNSAVFSDGSFVYIPKRVKCPLELSSYFRINEKITGQFERTLIIAEEDSFVSYLEGCTAPAYDENQLHAAIVEIVVMKDAHVKYSTVQNWYAGDPSTGKGGIFNFVTKRALCMGKRAKISWSQVEVGAAITWKYPSCILQGEESSGEFYSVALTSGKMQADTGTKMIHIGKNTRSTILSKGISADFSHNTFRGLVKIYPEAKGAKNFSQCDSMLVGNLSSANTFPTLDVENSSSEVAHEASTSKMSEEQIVYLQSRGIPKEDAILMIVNGFCKEVIKELPLEFAQETKKLLSLKLEKSIG